MYKPSNIPFILEEPEKYRKISTTIVIGDFNSHIVVWGYAENNDDEEAVEDWPKRNDITIMHYFKLSPFFNFGRWRRGNIFVSEIMTIRNMSIKQYTGSYPKNSTLTSSMSDKYNNITPRTVSYDPISKVLNG